MGQPFHLESFDPAASKQQRDHPEFTRGQEVGFASGLKDAVEKADADFCNLVAVLQDVNFTYAEARQAILAELSPILEAMVSSILPIVIAEGLTGSIVEILAEAVTTELPQSPKISVHPDTLPALSAALESQGALTVELHPDKDMSRDQAWIKIGSEERSIDFCNVNSAVLSALNTFTEPAKRKNG